PSQPSPPPLLRSSIPVPSPHLHKVLNSSSGSEAMEHYMGKATDDPASMTTHDEGFAQYCSDDALIWKLYMERAKETNKNLAENFNSNLDPLLIFATLFSAILTAFLVELQKDLQDRPDTANGLVLADTGQNDALIRQTLVNRFWSLSLMFSLMSALGASVAKGWITQLSPVNPGTLWKDASEHSRHVVEIRRWQMKFVIECLPVLVHIAFFLFVAGLVVLLFPDDRHLAIALLALSGISAFIYCGSSVYAVFDRNIPFRSPVSEIIYGLWNSSWRYKRFPPNPEVMKAKALSWLLTQSLDVATITPVIQAIAGLTSSPAVQDELLNNNATVGALLRALSFGLAKNPPDTEILSMSLYAILQLLQAAPLDKHRAGPICSLEALVDSGGALYHIWSMPFQVQRIACCVKARILLLLHTQDRVRETELFDIAIPILKESTRPAGSLRGVLMGIQFLSENSDLLSSLQAAKERDQGHANLVAMVKTAAEMGPKNKQSQKRLETPSTGRFSPAPLLAALQTPSPQSQRVYTKILSFLAVDALGSFRSLLQRSQSAQQICKLLLLEDQEARQHVMDALSRFADDVFDAVIGFMADFAKKSNDIQRIIGKSSLMKTLAYRMKTNNTTLQLAREAFQKLADLYHDSLVEDCMEAIEKLINHGDALSNISYLTDLDPEDIWPLMSSQGTIETIHAMMENQDPRIQKFALYVIEVLVQQGESPRNSVRFSALSILASSGSDSHIAQTINAVLVDPAQQGSALEIISTLAFAFQIFDLIQRAFTVLNQANEISLRIEALRAITALAQHTSLGTDDIWKDITIPSTTLGIIIEMMKNEDDDARESALAVLYHDNFHATAQVVAEALPEILALSKDPSDRLCSLALDILAALASHGMRCHFISQIEKHLGNLEQEDNGDGGGITKILLQWLEHTNEDVRVSAVKLVGTLVKGEQLPPQKVILEKTQKLLEDEDWRVRHSAVNTLVVLIEGGEFREIARNTAGEHELIEDTEPADVETAFETILSKLSDSDDDVQSAARDATGAFARFGELGACNSIFGLTSLIVASSKRDQNLVQGILRKMLDTDSPDRKQLALTALAIVASLSKNHLLTTSFLNCILIAEFKPQRGMMERIILMLADSNPDVRTLARKAALAVVENDSDEISESQSFLQTSARQTALSGKLGLTGKLQDTIAKMVSNASSRIRRSSLIHAAALNKYDDVRSAEETTQNVLSLLTDKSGSVKKEALETLRVIAQDGQIAKQIAGLLVDPNEDVQQSAVQIITEFLEHGMIYIALSVNNAGTKIVSILDKIVRPNIAINAGINLLTAVLGQVVDASPETRQLYTSVVGVLPLA
ncbi:armadillo-type protein, partial [Mycena sanguinolenta]